MAPAKITSFRSTETRLLLGEDAFDDPETMKQDRMERRNKKLLAGAGGAAGAKK